MRSLVVIGMVIITIVLVGCSTMDPFVGEGVGFQLKEDKPKSMGLSKDTTSRPLVTDTTSKHENINIW